MRVALCVVGQLLRLETTSKATFLANHENVDAFLVLQATNRYSRNVSKATRSCAQTSVSKSHAETLHPVHTTWTSSSDAVLAAHLTSRLSTKYTTTRYIELHAYQYQNWRQCALDVEEHEWKANITYDYVIRVRDNAIIMGDLLATLDQDHCTTKRCMSWGGLHDKVMTCPRRFMQPMLRDPVENLLFGSARYETDTNTETTLERTLNSSNVPVRRIDWFPVQDARPCACNATHLLKWCMSTKDCRPKPT